MDQRPDSALVEEALGGGIDAFAALVRRYQHCAYGLAVGRVCDFDLARDVVEEAFLCAYRDLPTLQKPSRFGGWLRGIVRNMSFRTFREFQRIRAVAEGLDLDEGLVARFRPDDPSAGEAVVRQTVRGALESLNDRSREAIGLHYADDLSPAEIADFVGASTPSVKKRLARVGEQLRGELPLIELAFEASRLPDEFPDTVAQLLEDGDGSAREREEADAEPGGPLGEALGDPLECARRAAAHALCICGDPRPLRPLLRLLHAGETPQVAGRQIDAALAVPGAREALLETLGKGRKVDRVYAMAALRRLGDDEEVRERIEGLFREGAGDGRLARLALFVLCDLQPGDAPDLVAEALGSPYGQVRGGAAWEALWRGLLPPLEDCLNCFGEGTDWWGRRCAGRLVLAHGDKGRAALERLMESTDGLQRLTAALALACAGSDAAFAALKRDLLGRKTDRTWRKAIAGAAGGDYPDELQGWLDKDGEAVADLPAVLWTLARGGVAEPTPLHQALAAEGEPAARAAALRIVARHNGADAIPLLRGCLREGRPRKVAQEAFRRMLELEEDAVPAAREMLESGQWTERKAGVCLLRRWGLLTDDEQAAAVEDPHVAVRHAAGFRPPPMGG